MRTNRHPPPSRRWGTPPLRRADKTFAPVSRWPVGKEALSSSSDVGLSPKLNFPELVGSARKLTALLTSPASKACR